MLKEIIVQNFRAFSEPVSVRVRPITVLIGQNSAGKSTLVKFLLMLRQTLEVREDAFLVTEGRHVHLGPFRGLRNTTSTDRSLRFRLSLDSEDLPPEPLRQVPEARSRKRAPLEMEQVNDNTIDFRIRLQKASRTAKSASFDISASVQYGKQPVRGNHSVIARVDDHKVFDQSSNNLRHAGFLHFPPVSDKPEDVFEAFLSSNFLGGIRYELRGIRHLSPIREESQRAVVVASPPPDDVGHCGEYAMPHLHRIWQEEPNGDRAAFVRHHMATVMGIEDLNFDTALRGYLAHCRAKNTLTGATNSLADFGFGVSQCLPIFVQGVMLHEGQLFIVEQPEAQLHPTAQLELGSLFADLWRSRKVPSLIETHSDHILLRLRRLVAKGELASADVSVAYFFVEDGVVRVRNLDVHGDGSIERGLPLEFFGANILESLELGAGT